MTDSSHPGGTFNNHSGRGERERGEEEGRGGRRGRGGRGRGRGRGYRGGKSGFWESPDPTPQWQTQGELLDMLHIGMISPTPRLLTIDNVEFIASYNWLDQNTPTILVPGSPPVWAPLSTPRRLESDSGDIYRDKNAARYPKHPYEPAIRAIFTMQPQFPSEKIDVVGCGSTVGNLLRFARSMDMSFRFDVEFIGNSVFFVRKENHPKEIIEGLYGHGHTFPEAYTNWETDVKGSTSHQRVIRYTFGELTYLIRTESDGWLPERLTSEELASAKADACLTKGDDDMASLEQAAESVSISQKTATTDDALELRHGGRKIPQKAVFDLKTRSALRKFNMADIIPRLWLNQTPNFLIGYHKFGLFEDIQVHAVHEQILEWEESNQRWLNPLSAVVHRIIEIAKSCKGQGLEISRFGTGELLIRKLLDDEWHALPSDLHRKWANGSDKDVVGSEVI